MISPEVPKCYGIDVELSLQVGVHLALHLVDLPECKHSLTDDAPGSVGVCVIADELRSFPLSTYRGGKYTRVS